MLTRKETPRALQEGGAGITGKAASPGGGGACESQRGDAGAEAAGGRGGQSSHRSVLSPGETLWSQRRVSQGEADPLHSGRADPCDFPKYGRLHWASPVAQLVKNLPAMQETWIRSLGREDLLEEEMATHSSILAWRIPMDRGAW